MATFDVPSIFRVWFGLLIVCVSLALGSANVVRAQSFTLSATALKVALFDPNGGYGSSYRDVAIQSADPAFDFSKISVSTPENVGIYTVRLNGGRTLRIRCYYASGQNNTVKVTVRSATQTSTIAVSRVCFTKYRTPKFLVSPDQLFLYALYQDTVLAFDARTRDLVASARLALPAGATFAPNSGRAFSFSSDGNELHIFLSGFGGSLFRLSRATLKSLPTVAIPAPAKGFFGRLFIGERSQRLYFARFDNVTQGWSFYDKYYGSALEVVSFPDGKLLQSLPVPPPTVARYGQFHGEDFTLHPVRPELWMRERFRVGEWGNGMCLRKAPLDPDGLVSAVPATNLSLTTYYTESAREPWMESSSLLLLASGSGQAVANSFLLSDATPGPVGLGSLPITPTFLSAGDIAASPAYIVRLGTKEYFPSSILGASGDWSSIVALSADGRTVFTLGGDSGGGSDFDPAPVSHFLPERFAALAANKVRMPRDGSISDTTSTLSWYPLPAPDRYRLYLSTAADDLSPAVPSPHVLLAEPVEARLHLPLPLPAGATYFWRVDAVYGDRVVRGDVQSFSVSRARVEAQPRQVATVAGARRRDFSVPVVASSADVAWQLFSDTPWISVRAGSSIGSGSAELSLDAGALVAGPHSATLRLVTAEGSVPVAFAVTVLQFSAHSWFPLPGAPRVVAIGPQATSNGVAERFLLSIDTAAEELHLCAAVPAASLSNQAEPALHSATTAGSPFYLHAGYRAYAEFDPESLVLKRTIRTPDNDSGFQGAIAIRPQGDGRLWMLDYRNRLVRFDPATSACDFRSSTEIVANAVHLADDGRSLFTFTHVRDTNRGFITSATFRRYDVVAQDLALAAEKTVALAPGAASEGDTPVWGGHPLRFSFAGVIYDESLEPCAALRDTITIVSPDASAVFGHSMMYLGDDYAEARVLPAYHPLHRIVYAPDSRKVAFTDITTGGLGFYSVDQLVLVAPVALKTGAIRDTTASFAWETPPTFFTSPGAYYSSVVEYRKAGSDEAWRRGTFHIEGLSPETIYEARACGFDARGYRAGPISGWSPVITFSTTVARPARATTGWPAYQDFNVGDTISLPFPTEGKDLVWEVTGLPPGLSFNTETRTLEGMLSQPGTLNITFRVSNPGGGIDYSLAVRVAGTGSASASARYTGLLELEGGPLSGVWSLTRSGSIVTGTYRTPLFTKSFKASFGEPFLYYYPYSRRRYAETTVRYEGVNIGLHLHWDLDIDRILLGAYTWELEDNYGAETTAETGLASHWAKTTRPHPGAARYSNLLYPGEGSGPHGSGFFTFDLAADGTAKISGETSLGQKFTQSLPVSDVHSLPFFYFSGMTLAVGEMQLTYDLAPDAPSPRLVGALAWARDANRKSAFYRAGFEQQLLVIGAPLPPVGKSLPPLDPLANSENRADFRLSGGGLARLSNPITQTLTPTATGLTAPKAGTAENPNRVSAKLNAETGVVTGSAAILNATGKKIVRTQSYRAMLVKDPLGDGQDVIGGYFHLPDGAGAQQSGLVEITEPEIEAESDSVP